MEQFDVLVIGSGSGMLIASVAVDQGFKVALVEQGKMGGTCINVGCVPSKMLIYPADILATLKDAGKLGVNAKVDSVDFNNIMERMHELVNHDSETQVAAVAATPNLTWFKEKANSSRITPCRSAHKSSLQRRSSSFQAFALRHPRLRV